MTDPFADYRIIPFKDDGPAFYVAATHTPSGRDAFAIVRGVTREADVLSRAAAQLAKVLERSPPR